ncbi:MAG: hypothetical protein ABWY63_14225 [Hyphomicrobiaceae bacterium]
MINLLIYVVVVILVVGLVYWLVDAIPVPEPLNRIAKILIIVVGCLALIYALLGLSGNAPVLPR